MFVFPVTLVLLLTPAHVAGDGVRFVPLTSGAGKKIGYYGPSKVELSPEKPAAITKVPEGLAAPLFGKLEPAGWGGQGGVTLSYHVIVDEPDDAEPGSFKLFVDSNANGDFTDDPPAEWKGRLGKTDDELTFMTYTGGALLNFGTEAKPYLARFGFYRFDKTDERRTQTRNALLYYRDYATEGHLTLGSKKYRAMLSDERCRGDYRGRPPAPDAPPTAPYHSGVSLLIDVNANGRFDNKGENFDSLRPFNIGGTTYELADVAQDGTSFRIITSSKTVDEIPTPPDHTRGRNITPFVATTMDGRTINFPSDYKGKVVMLDFWATWCGPCIQEMPKVVESYQKHNASGFEVLGITFDQKGADEKIKSTIAERQMTWPQIYDGLGWQTAIGQLYVVQGIPAAYLVDGDTGIILAEGGDLRNEKMIPSIDKAMNMHARKLGKIRDSWTPTMGGD